MAPPLAKNRPVPAAPPMAIMLNCRVPMLRWSPQGSFDVAASVGVAARFDVMPRAWHTVAGSAPTKGAASARSIDRQLAVGATGIGFGQLRLGGPLGSDERLELGCGQGFTEVISLILVAADGLQKVELRG